MAKLTLTIKNKEPYRIDDFIVLHLLPKYRETFRMFLNKYRCSLIEGKVKESIDIGKNSLYKVLYDSVSHTYMRKDLTNTLSIVIDENAKIPGTNTTYERVASLVNFGTLSVKPYPVYEQAMLLLRQTYKSHWYEYYGGL